MVINIFEPKKQYQTNKNQIHKVIHTVLESGNYILGKEVKKLEKNFETYLNCKKAIGVKNGTDALILALRAINIKKGDEVITTSHTALATIAAIVNVGATPVIVDIEKNYYTIDSSKIIKKINKKTKAIVPVHIYGQCCDMKEIINIAKKKKIFVVEDCAQSLGSQIGRKKVGTFGDIGIFSFYPTKILGAIGDGGMIVTNNKSLGKKLYKMREYGWDANRTTRGTGINSRLDEIQAGILNIKFRNLDKANEKRIKISQYYIKKISNNLIRLPEVRPNTKHIFHIFAILVNNRNRFIKYLRKKKINPGIHYPKPACFNNGYKEKCLFLKKDIKRTIFISKSTVSIPIYPELHKKNLTKIVRILNDYKK